MFLNRIILHDFKNIAEADVSFSPKVNYIYGSNGAGKTNLLDAVYYLSMTKSYFSSSDQYVYAYGAEEATLCGFYQMEQRLALHLTAQSSFQAMSSCWTISPRSAEKT